MQTQTFTPQAAYTVTHPEPGVTIYGKPQPDRASGSYQDRISRVLKTPVTVYHEGQLTDDTLICFMLDTRIDVAGLMATLAIHSIEHGVLYCSMTLSELLKNEH